MPKQPDGLGQGAETGYQQSSYQQRQAIDPMQPDEAEAFDWVLRKLSAEDPDAETRDLIQDGLDEGWFLEDEQGLLRVNSEAPGAEQPLADQANKQPPQYEGAQEPAG